MKIYDETIHYEQIQSWLDKRKHVRIPKDLFPHTGYVVEGVACGFLYETGCPIAFLEMYVTNPETDVETRRKALDTITKALIYYATLKNIRFLRADSRINSIKSIALGNGFQDLGETNALLKEIR